MRPVLRRGPVSHALSDPTDSSAPAPARPRRALRGLAHGTLLLALVGGTAAHASIQASTQSPDAAVPAAFAEDLARAAGAESEPATGQAAESFLTASGSRSAPRAPLTRTVTVIADGQSRSLTTDAATVADVLAEAGIALGPDDEVSVPLHVTGPIGPSLVVSRVRFVDVTEQVAIPFEIVERRDDTLASGRREIQTAGAAGTQTVSFRARLIDGAEVSREEILRTVVEPRDEVVRVGTKVASPAPSAVASRAAGPGPSSSGAAAGPVVAGDPRAIARSMVAARGWGADQFACLDRLWTKESNWNPRAQNPSSGAYGIPQSLPGSKMATVAADWRTNPATQITWGLNYIAGRYGTPCGAWAHSQAVNWY